jgi:hypothetical protein
MIKPGGFKSSLDAAMEWNRMPFSMRGALIAGLLLGAKVKESMQWAEIAPEDQRELLKLDWNMMLGGKLGKR